VGTSRKKGLLPTEERDKAAPSAVNIEEEEERGVDLVRRKTLPVGLMPWIDQPSKRITGGSAEDIACRKGIHSWIISGGWRHRGWWSRSDMLDRHGIRRFSVIAEALVWEEVGYWDWVFLFLGGIELLYSSCSELKTFFLRASSGGWTRRRVQEEREATLLSWRGARSLGSS
jgi:hypothetical protein